MANYRQAPELRAIGDKCQNNSTGVEYRIPQSLMDIVFREFGNSPAVLRYLLVLVGTKPGFKISEKWVIERSQVSARSLSNIRSTLQKKGWVTFDQGDNITVNFDAIYGNRDATVATQKKEEEKIEMQPLLVNDLQPLLVKRDATVAGIINNIEIVKEIVNNEMSSETSSEAISLETLTPQQAYAKYGDLVMNRIPTGEPDVFWIAGERVRLSK